MQKIKISNDLDNCIENNTNTKKIIHLFCKNFFNELKINFLLIYIILIIIFYCILALYLKIYNILNYFENRFNNITNYLSKNNLINNERAFLEKYKRNSIQWPLPKEIIFKPKMTLKEQKAFCYFMKPKNVYFEYGSGGSTNIASYYKVKTFSVESDVKWHQKLKDNNINANYITVDLKSHYYGFPGKETNIENWKQYIQSYKQEYNADIILIDGRFRVACGLYIFNKIRNDTIVLIHDYTNRKYYHILENYYLKLEIWDSLAAFIKRPNIDFIPKEIYNKYIKNQKI